ncbi:hypothetical protein JRI60_27815 [Archangium violaceum]|uniref:hypothetical protein n=1 Tax=Archangium violaceum TaxID=83451 RepID=UPI001951A6FB|nr:hypothetical protein [Archangium violaceum]QRN93014.1 hypothetical protein JRI60_27815 [Archangium violaceum]
MLKVLLVLLFSPCFLCLGTSAFFWARDTLRVHGIGTGTSVWQALGPPLQHNLPDNGIFIGDHSAFYTQGHYPEEGDTLWRVTPTGPRRWYFFPGSALSLASAQGVWFGVLSLPHPAGGRDRLFKLVRSRDEGRTWEDRGVVPSMSRLLVVSEQEVWGLGHEGLYVSTDGGQTVKRVPLPGTRDSIIERLARGLDGTVWLLGPEGLFRISEHGEQWTHEPMPGVKLEDGDGGILVGRVAETLAIRRDAPGAQWIPFCFRRHRVQSFAVSGDTIRVITGSIDPFEDGADVWYHHSEDGGRTWAHMQTGLAIAMALHGREWGAGMNFIGQLYGRVPIR